jgi:prepilin-type processing-associated H-X9-DG protein
MAIKPKKISRNDGNLISIIWSDGDATSISGKKLREVCPCATCREERGETAHEKPISSKSGSTKKLLKIVNSSAAQANNVAHISLVGDYAVNITFADGHGSGIFTFELLSRL